MSRLEQESVLDDWAKDLGIEEDVDENTINEMEVQHFYDRMERKPVVLPVTKDAVKGLREDLSQLLDLHDKGIIEQHLPGVAYKDLDNPNVNGETISGKERLDRVYDMMALRIDNMMYDCDPYGYEDDLMTGETLEESRFQNVKSIKHSLMTNDRETVRDCVSYLATIEDELEDTKPLSPTKEQYDEMVRGLNFEAIPQFLVDTHQKITDYHIDVINHKISENYAAICEKHDLDCAQSEVYRTMADKSEQIRKEYGISMDDVNLPAYLEQEIGSTVSPDDLRDFALQNTADAESLYKDNLQHLYERVYKVQTYDLSKAPVEVTGRRRDMSKDTPILVKSETIKMLGSDYEAFCNTQFEDTLQNMLERNVGKKTSVMGVDITRDVQVSADVVQSEKEVVEEQKLTSEHQSQSSVSTQRALPSNVSEKVVYNQADVNDDYSYDEYE